MSNTEPAGVPAGGSSLSGDDEPTGNDGTAGVDAPSGDAGNANDLVDSARDEQTTPEGAAENDDNDTEYREEMDK